MSIPEIGKASPPFTLPATGAEPPGQTISLSSLKGSKVVLYFYPRDATPGCTSESQNFRDAHTGFLQAGAIVLGLSQDTLASHEKFKAKESMPFDLLSDEDGSVCRAFDVIRLKKMYGKEFEGIERSTFLIDAKGVLRQAWRKVKVPGHVDEVLAAVQAL
ncbi:MAG: peroxiredoxin [Granulosicoccus sp.]